MATTHRPLLALVRKELRAQIGWLALWFVTMHALMLLFFVGVAMLQLADTAMDLPPELERDGSLLPLAFMAVLGRDSSALTFASLGVFFFAGGYHIFRSESSQRTLVWLRTMPVHSGNIATVKMLVSGLYVLLAATPGLAIAAIIQMTHGPARSLAMTQGISPLFLVPHVLKDLFFCFLVMLTCYLVGAFIGARARAEGPWWRALLAAAIWLGIMLPAAILLVAFTQILTGRPAGFFYGSMQFVAPAHAVACALLTVLVYRSFSRKTVGD